MIHSSIFSHCNSLVFCSGRYDDIKHLSTEEQTKILQGLETFINQVMHENLARHVSKRSDDAEDAGDELTSRVHRAAVRQLTVVRLQRERSRR